MQAARDGVHTLRPIIIRTHPMAGHEGQMGRDVSSEATVVATKESQMPAGSGWGHGDGMELNGWLMSTRNGTAKHKLLFGSRVYHPASKRTEPG